MPDHRGSSSSALIDVEVALESRRATRKGQPSTAGYAALGVRRKAAVVIGIRKGLITREDACKRYLLSTEELASWEADFAEYGHTGL